MLPESDLERLVKSAQNGDHEAFIALVEQLRPRLWARAFARAGETGAAEDLIQDACLLAFRKLSELKEPRAIGAWMLAMLDRLAARERARRQNALRHADLHEELLREAPAPSLDDGAAWLESLEELRGAVGNLDDDERELLALRFEAGMSAPEIAREMGATSGAVRARLCRAVQKLRNLLGALL